jgi:hypothetical protein
MIERLVAWSTELKHWWGSLAGPRSARIPAVVRRDPSRTEASPASQALHATHASRAPRSPAKARHDRCSADTRRRTLDAPRQDHQCGKRSGHDPSRSLSRAPTTGRPPSRLMARSAPGLVANATFNGVAIKHGMRTAEELTCFLGPCRFPRRAEHLGEPGQLIALLARQSLVRSYPAPFQSRLWNWTKLEPTSSGAKVSARRTSAATDKPLSIALD